MRITGVDLAASPPTTAVAVLEGLRLVEVLVGADDDAIVERCAGSVKVGIDSPFGWPRAFVAFVRAQEDGSTPAAAATVADRDVLAYRDTDRWVREHHPPLRPLSVSADRIGHAAMRCAALLPRIESPVDRTGRGIAAETYPSGSLLVWGLPFRGYKGPDGTAARAQIVAALAEVVDLGPGRESCLASDHALDAVVAALAARAAAMGAATFPEPGRLDVARQEGWIVLPSCALADLAG